MIWSSDRTNFDRSIAVVIGINDYQNGIHPLSTPVNDATVLADLLKTEQKYQEIVCLFPPYKEATLKNINELLKETLPNQIRPTQGDRLLFYFAGHGIARNSEDGPAGYLIPQDAQLGKLETFLPMRDLNAALSQLDCHHLLVILDCCFAGNFRWSSARNVIPVPETIHREHYDRFIRCSAWQAITSAAYNQEALDFLSDLRDPVKNSHHSPFALALIEGLKDNKADLTGDGVITAPELYLYLRDRLIGKDGYSELQTPGLWPLPKHDRGEFIFTLPGFKREQLKPAPPLNENNNPYRGLRPYDEKHARFFFGRQELVEELYKKILPADQSSNQLIAVLGISGSGKSSLVKAGLIPYLRKNHEKEWQILEPLRPGKSPFIALATTLLPIRNVSSDATSKYVKQLVRGLKKGDSQPLIDEIWTWSQANSQVKLLLTIDQFEELITMSRKASYANSYPESDSIKQKSQNWLYKVFRCQPKAKNNNQKEQKDEAQQEWQQFLALLINTLKNCPQLHIILTLRSDFEARFVESPFKEYWDKARFPVRPMRSDELREAIEKPASEMALCFEPANAVDRLIDEVGEMPGALPLLSFTLSEFYIKLHQAWIKEGKEDRAITVDEEFYKQGGIAGSLTYRANEIYDSLPDNARRDTMRRVMLRMLDIQSGEPVRRRVSKSELNYPDPDENTRVEYVINCLDQARLVVKGQEASEAYVEPAHDFLVKGWNKLQDWIKEEQENLALQRLLTDAALAWEGNNRNVGDLWDNNSRLERLKEIRGANQKKRFSSTNQKSEENWLNQLETKFVDSSIQRRRNRRNFLVTSVMGVILFLSGATIVALIGQRNAIIGQIQANQEASETSLFSGQPIEAFVNALRAGTTLEYYPLLQVLRPDPQLQKLQNQVGNVLYRSITQTKERNRLKGHRSMVLSATFSPDSQYIVTTSRDNTARVWNLQGQSVAELKGHRGWVNSANFNPNGQYIVTTSGDNTAQVWNLQGQSVVELKGHRGWVNSANFSPNGQYIVTTSRDNTARVWNLQGQSVVELKGHRGWVNSANFSPNGQYIVTTSRDNTARVWNLQGQSVVELKGHRGWVNSANFSPNGQYIVTTSWDFSTASGDNTVRVWNLQGQSVAELKGHQDIVNSAEFSPNGQYIITASNDNTARVWNLQGQSVAELKGHRNWVNSAKFSPNGQYIITASNDNTARVWNLQGQSVAELKGHQNYVTSAKFSPNGQYIVTASWDNTARVWNLQEQSVVELKVHQGRLYRASANFSPNGQYIVAISGGNTARVWNLQGQSVAELKGHQSYLTSAKFSPNSQYIITASNDNTARVWNLQGQSVAELKGHQGRVNSAEFSPNGQYIITFSNDKKVRMWNLQGKSVAELKEPRDYINSAELSPDGQYIVTASMDGTAWLWNLQGQSVAELKGHQDSSINSAKFSPNSQYIVAASMDGTAWLWNLQGQLAAKLNGHHGPVNSAEFSPNGQYIVTFSGDNTARVWNLQGQSVAELKGHQSYLTSAKFSPNSQYIITASNDNTARVWNLQGQSVAELNGHHGPVNSAEFSSNGQYIVTASMDNTVRVWPFREFDELLALGCKQMRDYLKNNPYVEKEDHNLCRRDSL